MRKANYLSNFNSRREQHKNRKQLTDNQLHAGSDGMAATNFSATNSKIGASVGGQFKKWSGEIHGRANVSERLSEEIKRVRKDTPQTAFHLRLGKSSTKQGYEPSGLNFSNVNGSFSNSDLDMMQNPEEDLQLELSEGLNTFKAGFSGTKHRLRRNAGEFRGANAEEYAGVQAKEQLNDRRDEEMTKILDDAIRQLIEIIESNELYIPLEFKDSLLLPIVIFAINVKGSSYKGE
eukprot:TRINITY_DN12707_c0_g2_i1.p1 TRINITY_DN12707_c0_g2~~TRINITY_DN12707_c0_g2_i1.p1  ORF type:complete len:234 (+),score=52.49 TRINITY_DN12707_c0_g2_i1:1237-1938(+)